MFFHLTYEDALDLEKIHDASLREAYQAQIYHFGQTPSQVFAQPHPARLPLVHCAPRRGLAFPVLLPPSYHAVRVLPGTSAMVPLTAAIAASTIADAGARNSQRGRRSKPQLASAVAVARRSSAFISSRAPIATADQPAHSQEGGIFSKFVRRFSTNSESAASLAAAAAATAAAEEAADLHWHSMAQPKSLLEAPIVQVHFVL